VGESHGVDESHSVACRHSVGESHAPDDKDRSLYGSRNGFPKLPGKGLRLLALLLRKPDIGLLLFEAMEPAVQLKQSKLMVACDFCSVP